MGSMIPRVQRRKKSLKKETHSVFLYANMVRITQIKDISKHYSLLAKIGEGASGTVYKAISHSTSHIRAIKQISKRLQGGPTSLLQMEFAILKTLDHPNIVKMYEILQSPNDIYIVTELCSGVELFELLMKVKRFPERIARGIMFQIVSAIRHMHEQHFMHRDIKPENVIYDEHSKMVKLIDLSSATFFQNSQVAKRKRIGTSYYIAPEVLERCYNEKCDSWSLGIIMYVLLSGEPPFGGEEDIDILKNVLYGQLEFSKQVWRGITDSAKKLIRKLIERDPQKRISIAQAMQDLWFRQYLKQKQKEQIEGNYILNSLMNLKKFRQVKSANIQDGVLIFIVNFVNQNDHEQQLIRSFKALDLNGDGKLSLEEMTQGLKKYLKINIKDAQIMAKHIFQKVDLNNSGFIDYSQFLVAASTMEVVISEENIDLAFDCFDYNKDNKISAEEFRQKLDSSISEQQYKKLLKQFDKNNDNQISREQFKGMMLNLLNNNRV